MTTETTPPALVEAGRRAGLLDPDVLRLAELGDPEQVVADLKRRFPGAFAKLANEMTDQEFAEGLREHTRTSRTAAAPRPNDGPPKSCLEMDAKELTVFERQHGISTAWRRT